MRFCSGIAKPTKGSAKNHGGQGVDFRKQRWETFVALHPAQKQVEFAGFLLLSVCLREPVRMI